MKRLGAKVAMAVVLGLPSVACDQKAAPADPQISAELSRYVLNAVPTDIPHRSFFDFEGKVHLLGYAIAPEGEAKPGSTVKITLYWQSVAPLRGGWQLFTHLLDPQAPPRTGTVNLDNEGPLRARTTVNGRTTQALAPVFWKPGHVYIDEQSFQIPKDTRTPLLTYTVGIWQDGSWAGRPAAADSAQAPAPPAPVIPDCRLNVISGVHDGENRAIVVNIPTGVVPSAVASAEPPKVLKVTKPYQH